MARYFISCAALFLLLAVLPFLAFGARDHPSVGALENQCVYTVYVKTGTDDNAGTDSTIGLELTDPAGTVFKINDLKSWGGLMGGILYNYYQKGNLDIFSGRGPCLEGWVCKVKVTRSKGLFHPSWLCDQVEVTMATPDTGCMRSVFSANKWLDNDVNFELDYCSNLAKNNSLGGRSIISSVVKE